MLENRLNLAMLPTEVAPLPRLSAHLKGPEIWIKRDDQTGLALGGNKTRKLEYLMFDAQHQGADIVITAGSVQSNHCRQTAAAAARLGMACVLVLGGERPNDTNGNLLLDDLLGAQVHWAGEKRKGEDIPTLVNTLKKQGKSPYVVPYGGSSWLGAMGYVNAMVEYGQQNTPNFSHMVFASSSGGTHAGILTGARLISESASLVGIKIDKEDGEKPYPKVVTELANQCCDVLGLAPVFEKDVLLNESCLGGGYAVIGDAEREAIKLMAQLEGIILDPVYTGRAMAGLLQMIRSGQLNQNDRVLFWHTGGAPALFAYASEMSSD